MATDESIIGRMAAELMEQRSKLATARLPRSRQRYSLSTSIMATDSKRPSTSSRLLALLATKASAWSSGRSRTSLRAVPEAFKMTAVAVLAQGPDSADRR
jgi:hypothetical protein